MVFMSLGDPSLLRVSDSVFLVCEGLSNRRAISKKQRDEPRSSAKILSFQTSVRLELNSE